MMMPWLSYNSLILKKTEKILGAPFVVEKGKGSMAYSM
jgi:hypothetical protein